jgi:TPR repeat protein
MKDYVAAAAWFTKSADGGFPAAIANLGVMVEEGLGVAQSLSRAGELYEMAARANHPVALFQMGKMVEQGRGTKPDPIAAYVLYEQAAERYRPAARARDALAQRLTTAQIEEAKSRLEKANRAVPPATDEKEESGG